MSVYDLKAMECLTIIIIYFIKIYTKFYFQIGILNPLSNTSHGRFKVETHKEGIWSKRTKLTVEVFYSSGPTYNRYLRNTNAFVFLTNMMIWHPDFYKIKIKLNIN